MTLNYTLFSYILFGILVNIVIIYYIKSKSTPFCIMFSVGISVIVGGGSTLVQYGYDDYDYCGDILFK